MKAPHNRCVIQSAAGFTLIELLVVIAIIAILAALLLPSLVKAKVEAHRVECISRLKQWAIAFHAYADDNEGLLPREGYHSSGDVVINNRAHVQDPKSRDVWYNALAEHVARPSAASYIQAARYGDFYERDSFFHCPSAKFQGNEASQQEVFFTLAMSSSLIEPGRTPTIKRQQIANESQTVLMLDNLLKPEKAVVEGQAIWSLGQPSADAQRFAGRRHGRSGNLLFADGSADSFRGEQVVETQGPGRGGPIRPERNIRWDP